MRWFGAVAAAAMLMAGGQAGAISYAFHYTASGSSGPQRASGRIDVAAVPDSDLGRVLAISGDVDGDTIAGTITNPAGTAPSYSRDRLFIYDNVVTPDAMRVTNPGLFFGSIGGFEYNLFADGARHILYRAVPGGGYAGNSDGVLTMDAVPEPATWAMTVTGFAAIGIVARRRRGRSVAC